MRLIDADELKNIVGGSDNLIDSQKDELKLCVDACNTAYDVDKVVEQIRAMEICGDCLNNKNTISVCATFCDVGKKFEIIKAGGVDK